MSSETPKSPSKKETQRCQSVDEKKSDDQFSLGKRKFSSQIKDEIDSDQEDKIEQPSLKVQKLYDKMI